MPNALTAFFIARHCGSGREARAAKRDHDVEEDHDKATQACIAVKEDALPVWHVPKVETNVSAKSTG